MERTKFEEIAREAHISEDDFDKLWIEAQAAERDCRMFSEAIGLPWKEEDFEDAVRTVATKWAKR